MELKITVDLKEIVDEIKGDPEFLSMFTTMGEIEKIAAVSSLVTCKIISQAIREQALL